MTERDMRRKGRSDSRLAVEVAVRGHPYVWLVR